MEPLTADETTRRNVLIGQYDTRGHIYSGAWFHYVAANRGVQPRRWAIRERSTTVGLLRGDLLHMVPFRLFASHLKGCKWNPNAPLINQNVDQEQLLPHFDDLECAVDSSHHFNKVAANTFQFPQDLGRDSLVRIEMMTIVWEASCV